MTMSKLLPYETIVKAHEGDPDAIDTILSHYAGYIRYCSKVHGKVNAEVEEHIKQQLIAALNLFWMLEQCYNDVEVYHYIGWLRHFSGAQFSSLYALYEHDKINFKQNLQKIIINKDCKDRENVLI